MMVVWLRAQCAQWWLLALSQWWFGGCMISGAFEILLLLVWVAASSA